MAAGKHPLDGGVDDEEPPPFLGTWKRVYTFVVVYLVFLISLFAWFSRSYAS